MPRFVHLCVIALALGSALGVPAVCAAQSVPWQNDWIVQKPLSLEYAMYYDGTPQAPVVMSADGEILVRAPSAWRDDQLTRFTAAGSVRWSVNLGSIGGTDDPSAGAMIANADGSAFVATQYGSAVASIDAGGTVAWTTAVGVGSLALAGARLIVADCHAVASLNAANGRLEWQYGFANNGLCDLRNAVVDDSGNIYAVRGSDVLKLAPTGQLLWESFVYGASVVVGTPDDTVYVQTLGFNGYPSLAAVNAADGTARWLAPGFSGLALVGTPREPLTGSGAGAARLNARDGTLRWSQPLPNPLYQTYACSHGAKATVGASQLDVETGAIDWTAPLVLQDAFGYSLHYLGNLCHPDGSTTFIASSFSGAPPRVTRVDASGTPLTVPAIPDTAQGVTHWATAATADSVLAIAQDDNALGPGLRLRAVDRVGGATRWDTHSDPLGFVQYGQPTFGVAGAGDLALATLRASVSYTEQHYWVGGFEMISGAPRWQAVLPDLTPYEQVGTIAEASPLTDPAGDVILAYEAQITDNNVHFVHAQLTVLKLDRHDGHPVWRHDEVFPNYPLGFNPSIGTPYIALLGNDVLVNSQFAAPNDGKTLLKLSGGDGSVAWYSDVFADAYGVYSAFPVDDGNVVAFGSNRWAKLDAQTGAILWSNNDDTPCVSFCNNGGGVQMLPGGDLLFVGENASRPEVRLLPGHAGASPVVWSLDQDDTNVRQSYAWGLERDSAGGLWTRIQRRYPLYNQRTGYLAKLDIASGKVLSQQALYANDRDPLLPWISPLMLAAPEGDRLLAETYRNQPPLPYTNGVALLDTTITANGNLAVQFTTSGNKACRGRQIGFHVVATYSGDAPISGARVIADFPWTGHAHGVICGTSGAANCVLDPRASTLMATFDVQPGGRADITGFFDATDVPDPAVLSAIVVGPIGLNELVTADNASHANVVQSIFFDGFE